MQITKHILSFLILFISCFVTNAALHISAQAFETYPVYHYHTDHLGSTAWMTDYAGNVRQFMHYMPYGELFLNQQTSHYNERFKYTGKERDTETDYDYFDARYYSPNLTAWLSPDPLLDKYPGISPYAYCGWNPIMAIDLDGQDSIFFQIIEI